MRAPCCGRSFEARLRPISGGHSVRYHDPVPSRELSDAQARARDRVGGDAPRRPFLRGRRDTDRRRAADGHTPGPQRRGDGISSDPPGEKLVWGIVSDLDVLRAGIRTGADRVGAIAKQPNISVEPTMPLQEAGELMLEHGTTHVVVIDPTSQRPIGVLSTLDVAGVLAWGEA